MAESTGYPRYYRMDGYTLARMTAPDAMPELYIGGDTWEPRAIVPEIDGTPITEAEASAMKADAALRR